MLMDRRTAADFLGVSVKTLAKAATDPVYGPRSEASGVLPPVAVYRSNRALYCEAEIRACLATRETAELAGRLRAKQKIF
jgi:hypothetical protein